ncbi:WhiB family transcriptional regulator [Nocardiopsis changdeensis]|uniref:WhiB family transcriptional regulator n=1 Tax=Nocardiopsis TaxID=2013 RepID=UPI0024087DA0|nr:MULTISPECIES: WhiB family transcriptional regulator [Nocardiopsis]
MNATRLPRPERPTYAEIERAPCRREDVDPELHFLPGAAQNHVKALCRDCPVRVWCLAKALNEGIEFGVWGGMTERERRALLRRRANVRDWYALLTAAEQAHHRVLAGAGATP